MGEKKKKELPALKTALSGQEVNSGIDLRLSKSDLIEMVVEERKEQLHKELEVAQKELQKRNESLSKDERSLKKVLVAELNETHKSIIDLFKATFPKANVKAIVNGDHGFTTSSQVVTSSALMGTRFNTAEFSRKSLVDQTKRDSSYGGPTKARFQVQLQLSNPPSGPSSSLVLEAKASDEQLKEFRAEAKAIYEAYIESYNKVVDLKVELLELNSKGGRYKAELTKRLLGGTEAGKELLNAMEGVRALMLEKK